MAEGMMRQAARARAEGAASAGRETMRAHAERCARVPRGDADARFAYCASTSSRLNDDVT